MSKGDTKTDSHISYQKVTDKHETSSSLNTSENSHKEGGLKKNIIGLIVLTLLYTIQGIPLGFFKMSLPIVLAEKGAHFKDLGILSIMSFPYSIKFLVAPILDSFYFRRFGQRKSYIVPIQYLYTGVSLMLSHKMQEYVETSDIEMIFAYGLLCIIIVAIQDVAVDGWVLTILTEDYLSYGPATQTIGIMLGTVISFNLFIPLNSTRFCNSYFFSTPQEIPLVTVNGFWYFNALFVLSITVFVHFFVKEKELTSDEHISFKGVISIVALFYKNPNLRQLSIVCITQFICSMPIASFSENVLVKKGFRKEWIANINTGLAPVGILASVVIGRICKGNQELKLYMMGCGFAVIKSFFLLFVIASYSPEMNFYLIITLLTISYTGTTIQRQVSMIAISSFSNKISNEVETVAVGTTFISTRAALANFGATWVRSASLFLGEYIPWYFICSGASVFGVFYFFWFKSIMESLSKKKKHE